MFEIIKPAKICETLEYLVQTPLYIKNNINIDHDLFLNITKTLVQN